MIKQGIYHIPDVPFAYAINETTLYIKLQTAKDDIKQVRVYYKDRHAYEAPFQVKDMQWLQGSQVYDYFEVELRNVHKKFRYFFEIIDQEGKYFYYNERGIINHKPDVPQSFQLPYLCPGDFYQPVEWAKDGIMYQIFPDRFCNGNTKNDPQGVKQWGEPVKGNHDFFGGDLKGITNNLDYLKDLGVTIIYTTPIFQSSSNHKYNTKDYYEIDPQFGTKEELRELINEAHKRGIRFILDGVFNHSGDDFFAFQDVMQKGENSQYKDWYYIESFPINQQKLNYVTFYDRYGNMPKLNMSNPETVAYFLDVASYWLREFHVDGFRLDVCDEIDHYFLKKFYQRVKQVNPEAIVVGEIMHMGTSFCRGDELDATMNYPFREAVLEFFAIRCMSAEDFIEALAIRKHSLRKDIHKQMLNLLDSHDTARFVTDASGKKNRLQLATVFQYTYLGIPYIYYGDEVGLEGGNDPDCRRCMIWDKEEQDTKLHEHFIWLAKIRKEHKALVDGEFQLLYAKDNCLAYRRYLANEQILVLLNNKEDQTYTYDLPEGSFRDLRTGEVITGGQTWNVEPMGFAVLDKIN
ncbi:glycoside hydrolase family 13 protein [Anaerosporobacter faecicola]|uniref:glycoside hydrolase family 13 protein n=1 Tax=Anaerosporobacter faecicola TaxID=2718714 RepID=UPI00143958BC|nr:glycoside hydrolase family 13 protein [Anaerosporobacter faecicola]